MTSRPGELYEWTGSVMCSVKTTYFLFEFERLVHFPGEPVNEETAFPVSPPLRWSFLFQRSAHCILEKFDRHFHRHDCPFFNTRLDKVAVFRPFSVLLRSEKIASCENMLSCRSTWHKIVPERWQNPISWTSLAHCVPFPGLNNKTNTDAISDHLTSSRSS
jgi:hypothetical protein